ncbi:MAG: DUF1926 domain-containing protein [bacterium]|nr:DUF1926 domain-containing protein [bacterium]
MDKFKLAFGIHNHQPVGNFTAVFEEAHQRAYLPFLELLSKFEEIRISLHQSGILWDWQKQTHPEYFRLVGSMVDRGQIELMTGGFYEPILTSIPERDSRAQIHRLSQYLREHFEIDPSGLWLTERIWEPHLPRLLNESGVKYLPVDDTHFIYAGFEQSQLTGPFLTEESGASVVLLPIQKRLRYLMPFGKVEDLIAELKSQADRDPNGLAVYADDGEKFGVWPKTYEHCYEDGWLREFFQAVRQNSDWLEIIPLHEAAALKTVGRAYLPSASYQEMLHWSLPTKAYVEYEKFEETLKQAKMEERFGRFVRGGHWRGFLTKYEESNLMHKRMLAVSERLALVESENHALDTSRARDRLQAAQCNCPYWHGVFGGLYLPHIRQAIWEALISADSELDRLTEFSGVKEFRKDLDFDGQEEIGVATEQFHAIIKPSRGGSLLNLNLKGQNFDITDTLTRRTEGYHTHLDIAVLDGEPSNTSSIHDLILAKEPGLKELLVEDWYLKRCFIDHFLTPDVDLSKFFSAKFGEEGDFVLEPYTVEDNPEPGTVKLSRSGHLWRPEGVLPVQINKEFIFQASSNELTVRYTLTTSSDSPINVAFGVENNFNFQAGHAEDRFVLVDNIRPERSYLDSLDRHENASSLILFDQYRSIAVAQQTSEPAELWRMPIFTVSLSEGGFEKVYQGTTLLHLFRLSLSSTPQVLEFRMYAGHSETVPETYLVGSKARSGQNG